MIKVYLLWLHDSVLSVHATRAGALTEARRHQERIGGEWNATVDPNGPINRFYHRYDNYAPHASWIPFVSRLEVEERDVR